MWSSSSSTLKMITLVLCRKTVVCWRSSRWPKSCLTTKCSDCAWHVWNLETGVTTVRQWKWFRETCQKITVTTEIHYHLHYQSSTSNNPVPFPSRTHTHTHTHAHTHTISAMVRPTTMWVVILFDRFLKNYLFIYFKGERERDVCVCVCPRGEGNRVTATRALVV